MTFLWLLERLVPTIKGDRLKTNFEVIKDHRECGEG
jgi:hypothetical protein